MKRNELTDLVIDFGSPVEAALATGKRDEMISCLEELIAEDKEDLETLGDGDSFSVFIIRDSIRMSREAIEKLKVLPEEG